MDTFAEDTRRSLADPAGLAGSGSARAAFGPGGLERKAWSNLGAELRACLGRQRLALSGGQADAIRQSDAELRSLMWMLANQKVRTAAGRIPGGVNAEELRETLRVNRMLSDRGAGALGALIDAQLEQTGTGDVFQGEA